ncbi:GNAT family N-acetyltransferase [Kribbella sp. NPDC050124]|uniref:GNAT family N-acetyltransferase n=1 Tax=Kribbella sp. NPDC050124 TaxID=3364114 RepID=UPI0037A7F5A2
MSGNLQYEIVEQFAADLEQVRPLWGELLEHHHDVATQLARVAPGLTLDASWAIRRAQYVDWFANAAGRLWVARDGDGLLGYLFVHLGAVGASWDWGDKVGVLETLVVSQRARGAGLGTQLIELAQDYFKEADVTVAKVSVIAGNSGAIDLYRRLGFVDQLVTLVMPVSAGKVGG